MYTTCNTIGRIKQKSICIPLVLSKCLIIAGYYKYEISQWQSQQGNKCIDHGTNKNVSRQLYKWCRRQPQIK